MWFLWQVYTHPISKINIWLIGTQIFIMSTTIVVLVTQPLEKLARQRFGLQKPRQQEAASLDKALAEESTGPSLPPCRKGNPHCQEVVRETDQPYIVRMPADTAQQSDATSVLIGTTIGMAVGSDEIISANGCQNSFDDQSRRQP